MEADKKVVDNGIKLIGESIVPGASLLLDGRILAGGAHLLAGVAAKWALGPIGLAVVAANSFSRSVTGKNLLKQFSGEVEKFEGKHAEGKGKAAEGKGA